MVTRIIIFVFFLIKWYIQMSLSETNPNRNKNTIRIITIIIIIHGLLKSRLAADGRIAHDFTCLDYNTMHTYKYKIQIHIHKQII